MPFAYAGEVAAAGTVLCWTVSSLFFEAAGKRAGSLAVNFNRLVMAFAMFAVTLSVTRGSPLPFDFPLRAWGWLVLSGWAGFTFGDMCLFRAFVDVGPRVAMLVMSLVPAMAAILGWYFLYETYGPWQWLGMIVTIAGVASVVLERRPPRDGQQRLKARPVTMTGVMLAFGGAVGQATGLVMGKHGMGSLDAFAATQIRVIAGMAGFAVLFTALGWWPRVRRSLGNRPAMTLTAGGAFAGPFLGVALLMLAVQYTSTGVASTIVALVPLILIPAAIVIDKERVTLRAVCGTAVAVLGVILLVWNR